MTNGKLHKWLIAGLLSLILVFALAGAAQASDQSRYLYWGCQGADVAQLQTTLNSIGYNCGAADGIFGPKTYAAVVKLQRDKNCKVDGIVGPQTRQALASFTGNVSRGGSTTTPRYSSYIDMVATAYCPCNICNYPYGGQPSAIGLPLGPGIVAVDPTVIPLGTKLYVEGYGNAIAADTGGAIKGKRIDLCMSDHQTALNYGIQNVRVYILADQS
jgi:3D (Asp-Asp-Asp) domain-containing protein